MKGRKPTPNAVLKKRASKAVRKDEPEFKTGLFEIPAILAGRSLEIWHETLAELGSVGIGNKIEAHALVQYCQAVAQAEECQRILDRDGLIAETERGMTKHPATTIQAQAALRILRFAAEFGMTPASRGRVKVEKAQETNPFDDL